MWPAASRDLSSIVRASFVRIALMVLDGEGDVEEDVGDGDMGDIGIGDIAAAVIVVGWGRRRRRVRVGPVAHAVDLQRTARAGGTGLDPCAS